MKMGFSVGFSRFQIRFVLSPQDIIVRACELLTQVKMITDGHVAIAKGKCLVFDMGTQILTTKDIPANEADTLGDRFGELVESCDELRGCTS